MRFIPSDPDLQTIASRIEAGDIDLQPDFQRGEVWSKIKQQKLIDSILRNWHIPPIHVIQESDNRTSVLDGQQRLVSIRDFLRGHVEVAGRIQPLDQELVDYDGCTFQMLPMELQRRFLRYPLRVFTITDYEPSEPGELFYRLNQPSSLTAAEQRNAFFGQTRSQVKDLVSLAWEFGLDEGVFGFSNARMAYDDVITRALFLLDAGTLREKITASALADKYRSGHAFSPHSVEQLRKALELMGLAQHDMGGSIKFNKATAQSWLIFLAVASSIFYTLKPSVIANFMVSFERLRGFVSERIEPPDEVFEPFLPLHHRVAANACETYDSRSTARVADVSSVVLRDLALWLFFMPFARNLGFEFKPVSPDKVLLYEGIFTGRGTGLMGYGSLEWIAEDLNWGTYL